MSRDNIQTNDRQLACARINSVEGKQYLQVTVSVHYLIVTVHYLLINGHHLIISDNSLMYAKPPPPHPSRPPILLFPSP